MDPAEKQGLVDGALTFFGALGGGTFLAQVAGTPGATESALLAAGIAGAISGLNSYRRAANLAAAFPGANQLPTPPVPP